MTQAEADMASVVFSLGRPSEFVAGAPITEQELFEESSLGVMSARQSTNFRGHHQVTFGPEDAPVVAEILREMEGLDAPVLDDAAMVHVVLTRPYRTAFTLLLTFVGHSMLANLLTVPWRAFSKRWFHTDDIPTIGYLQHLHLGILADAMERAAVLASDGRRAAQVFMGPFASKEMRKRNRDGIARLQDMCGLTADDTSRGWRVGIVAQVGTVAQPIPMTREVCRKVAANLMAFRSERIQPGVNAEESAPDAYQHRQDMDVPEELAFMAARAAYNGFMHWSGCDRDQAKNLLLLERMDVLSDGGKERLRQIRKENNDITDLLIKNLPLWADMPLGKALSRNANRGRKAFALVGQRIYVGGLDKDEVTNAGLDTTLACQAFGAAASRSSKVCELSGCIDLPDSCDLLVGTCVMAGPVNQNDIGKQFYGFKDLLAGSHPDLNPTSMLVWTLKAKTVADPLGNEEQLLSAKRKGALVDLRPGPHEVVDIVVDGKRRALRKSGARVNQERAFADQGNFVTGPDNRPIPGNEGSAWPRKWANAVLWGNKG
tara:strand:+ start:855 stop:2489 length:1635 start_codon:yes stop_codon:yes gene_type:complete